MNIKQLKDDEVRVQIFKALADPARLEIIRVLRDKGDEMGCGEIGENLALSKSTISYHFKTLREAGLTTTRREAREKFVKLRYDTFEQYFTNFLDSL
ncbi:ArsR/SmtB family transcription factor [Isobaculum melis]|uniref:Helix-turn-helix domain-containing protein n=1 Tax=Isobaculum melis TaxID=142588 RepID=A0A1H9T3G1_9LACT|nr:metalloregulator ArsR/SmtB family transcription factor [Isobaculum melis]SER91666.1 Helix-turn-helix domain-containing protein [Isobaculum melis]